MIGKTISHYRILEELGRGGMGVVYMAEDTRLRRIVALKFLPPLLTLDPQANERFIHEARAASALDHPNICNIHDIDKTEDGQMFICMAYYEGEPLARKIERGPLDLENALETAVKIGEGLRRAHESGITHRDIKPANIVVTNRGEVKIVDFGLAKLAHKTKLTRDGTTLGTVEYMSPEQAGGGDVDQRTDIWSLGVVLYEMLTGSPPFRGGHEQAVIYSVLNEEPAPVSSLRAGVPPETDRIVSKALAKNPEERYQNVGDLLSDLRRLQKVGTYGHGPSGPAGRRYARKLAPVIAAAAVVVAALVLLRGFVFPPEAEAINAIAVLPLDNLSGDPSQDYFADGMTEELIADLAKIGTLKVISRTSVMRYKNTEKSLPEIADELGVNAIVEGSVLLTGGRVRITAQLIEAKKDQHLWAEHYERDLSDVIDIQREVARSIVGEIRVKLTPREKAALASAGPIDPEAHEAYLRARYHWNKRTKEGLDKCIEYLEQAIEKDPDYALAYAGLAEAYVILGDWGWFLPKDMYEKAEAIAQKALDLDPDLAEAYTAIGAVEYELYYDYDGAEEAFLRAIELKPGYATAHQWYSEMLRKPERWEESLEQIDRALELDPMSLIINYSKGWLLYYWGKYDEALEQAAKTRELNESFCSTRILIIHSMTAKGDTLGMEREYRDLLRLKGFGEEEIASFDRAYRDSGMRGADRWILDRWDEIIDETYNVPYYKAVSLTNLGRIDEVFANIEKLYEARSMYTLMVYCDPFFDVLSPDPRYVEIMKKLSLDKYLLDQ